MLQMHLSKVVLALNMLGVSLLLFIGPKLGFLLDLGA